MQSIVIYILLFSAVFFLWFGFAVELGIRKPDPFDTYFDLPVRGFNVEYMLGVAGIAVGVAATLLAAALYFNIDAFAWLAAVLFVGGIIRSFLSPYTAGPKWCRHKRKYKK